MADNVKNIRDEKLFKQAMENFAKAYPGYKPGYFIDKFGDDIKTPNDLSNAYKASLEVLGNCDHAREVQNIFDPREDSFSDYIQNNYTTEDAQRLQDELSQLTKEERNEYIATIEGLINAGPERPKPAICPNVKEETSGISK